MSEHPDKYSYCKTENNQIATFLKNSDFFRIKSELCLEKTIYASQNWNYWFVLKILDKVIHCQKSALDT